MNDIDATKTGEKHKMVIDPVGVISEIINNIGDQRDIIREVLSNASAKEVGAKKIEIRVYESDKGLALTVADDGRGMDYTKNDKNPGRLDRFLNAAQGKQAGFSSDEFGAKGFGTKLLYNADQVEIETWDGGENYYRVILNEPRRNILENKKLIEPYVITLPAAINPTQKMGTTITVKGWAGLKTIPKDFKMDRLERFLQYYSVVGYTKTDARGSPFPEFVVYVGAQQKTIKAGFNFITSDDRTEDIKTVTFKIPVEKKTDSGKIIRVTLKGGITTDTGKFQLTDETGGVWLSVNGIPYFKLPTNKYARKINMTDDFIRFVAECDDVTLNMSRSDFGFDEKYEAFDDALNEGFNKIKEDSKFQKFYQNKYKELRIKLQKQMNLKKEEFLSENKRYVWWNGMMVLAEPESEYDTAALLWILEGLHALPFAKFKTLQYPGYREGIDLLIDYQEEEDKEEHKCAYTELERLFSSFIRHKHDIGQMTIALCWRLDRGKITMGVINSTKKPYKYTYSFGDTTIPIFEISQFPGIFVGTKKEAKEHFNNQTK